MIFLIQSYSITNLINRFEFYYNSIAAIYTIKKHKLENKMNTKIQQFSFKFCEGLFAKDGEKKNTEAVSVLNDTLTLRLVKSQ